MAEGVNQNNTSSLIYSNEQTSRAEYKLSPCSVEIARHQSCVPVGVGDAFVKARGVAIIRNRRHRIVACP